MSNVTWAMILMLGGLVVAMAVWIWMACDRRRGGGGAGFIFACFIWGACVYGAFQLRTPETEADMNIRLDKHISYTKEQMYKALNKGDMGMARQWAKELDRTKAERDSK